MPSARVGSGATVVRAAKSTKRFEVARVAQPSEHNPLKVGLVEYGLGTISPAVPLKAESLGGAEGQDMDLIFSFGLIFLIFFASFRVFFSSSIFHLTIRFTPTHAELIRSNQ
jgi:hypothetical protein